MGKGAQLREQSNHATNDTTNDTPQATKTKQNVSLKLKNSININ